ncbi:MAG: hypothetical protein R3F20_15860 [Planctomycetota bacterium]
MASIQPAVFCFFGETRWRFPSCRTSHAAAGQAVHPRLLERDETASMLVPSASAMLDLGGEKPFSSMAGYSDLIQRWERSRYQARPSSGLWPPEEDPRPADRQVSWILV